MKISSKQEYYDLAAKGLLGNTLRTWSDPADVPDEPCLDKLSIRWKVPGRPFVFAKPRAELFRIWNASDKRGLICETITGSTIQGHIYRPNNEYVLLEWTTKQGSLRDVYRPENMTISTNAVAMGILRQYCDDASYEKIMELLDTYPDSVVEFTCTTLKLGWAKHNTIIWEVRNY